MPKRRIGVRGSSAFCVPHDTPPRGKRFASPSLMRDLRRGRRLAGAEHHDGSAIRSELEAAARATSAGTPQADRRRQRVHVFQPVLPGWSIPRPARGRPYVPVCSVISEGAWAIEDQPETGPLVLARDRLRVLWTRHDEPRIAPRPPPRFGRRSWLPSAALPADLATSYRGSRNPLFCACAGLVREPRREARAPRSVLPRSEAPIRPGTHQGRSYCRGHHGLGRNRGGVSHCSRKRDGSRPSRADACRDGTTEGDHAKHCMIAHYLADLQDGLAKEVASDESAVTARPFVEDVDSLRRLPSAPDMGPSLHRSR